jgi:hypothetical protein
MIPAASRPAPRTPTLRFPGVLGRLDTSHYPPAAGTLSRPLRAAEPHTSSED